MIIDGIINVKKPKGMTSFVCADRVRKITGARKAGHAGTLDPNAEGVLPVCINKGTKCMDFFLEAGKSYRGRIKFGFATDTMDIWGEVTRTGDLSLLSEKSFLDALQKFKGEILQLPPQYSAIKKDGVPLYKLARQGIFTEINPRKVTVYDIVPESFEEDEAIIFVKCSKGTYIRTLINDIGEEIGCLACMSGLTRTSYGPLSIEDAVTLEELQNEAKEGNPAKYVKPISILTEAFPDVYLSEEDFKNFSDGKKVVVEDKCLLRRNEKEFEAINVYFGNKLAAVAKTEAEGNGHVLIPWKYFGISEDN